MEMNHVITFTLECSVAKFTHVAFLLTTVQNVLQQSSTIWLSYSNQSRIFCACAITEWLEILPECLKINLRESTFPKISEGHAPRPPQWGHAKARPQCQCQLLQFPLPPISKSCINPWSMSSSPLSEILFCTLCKMSTKNSYVVLVLSVHIALQPQECVMIFVEIMLALLYSQKCQLAFCFRHRTATRIRSCCNCYTFSTGQFVRSLHHMVGHVPIIA